MATVDAPFPHRAELGEMPHWDAARTRLCYVDIDGGAVHELDVDTGELTTIHVAAPLGFAMPVRDTDTRVCGQGNDLITIDGVGTVLGRLEVEPAANGNRINEGKPDPAGRVWFGSMSKTRQSDAARLYRLDHDGIATIRPITIGNGTDWDVERNRMYHVDSTTQRIDVFDYDAATGDVENVRPFAHVDPADGLPDGLTIDSEGCVWVALFQGGAVRRFDPHGRVMLDIALPTPFTTCPAFGGHDLSTLFVTTSQHKIPHEERAGHPLAGALFTIDAGVTGRPANMVSAEVAAKVAS